MKDLNITEGSWRKHTRYPRIIQAVDEIGISMSVCEITDSHTNDSLLIIDAGNTAQKCGLLPSELLEQRDELLSALKSITRRLYKELNCPEYNSFIDKANRAIRKATE